MFMSTKDILLKKSTFFKSIYFFERGIFKNTEFFEKHGILKNVMKRPVFFSKDRTFERKLRLLHGEFLKTRNF